MEDQIRWSNLHDQHRLYCRRDRDVHKGVSLYGKEITRAAKIPGFKVDGQWQFDLKDAEE